MNIVSLVKNLVNSHFQFIKKGNYYDITIIDDVFPYYKSPWRNTEFVALANNFKIKVFCDSPQKNRFIPGNNTFYSLATDFELNYPNHKIDYEQLKLFSSLDTKIVYIQFVNYLQRYYNHIKRNNTKFVLKIYPGGGFYINNINIDSLLKEVCSDPNLMGVIVNQKFIFDYLIEKKILKEEQITLFRGGIMDTFGQIEASKRYSKKTYHLDKKTFDIAFAANKYTILGVDKGFDIFIEVAKALIIKYDFVRFHVVGNFSDIDLPYKNILDKFTFYGFQDQEFFSKFYSQIDVFISPNRQFVGNEGHVDGFPLGTTFEPAINKTVLLLTDYLNENIFLIDREDYFNINNGITCILEIIDFLIANPHEIVRVGQNGKIKFLEYFDYDRHVNQNVEYFYNVLRKL